MENTRRWFNWRKVMGHKAQFWSCICAASFPSKPRCDLWESPITGHTKTEGIRRWWEQCSALRTSLHDLSTNGRDEYDLLLIETWFKRVSREQMLESYFYNSYHMNGFENLFVKMASACICLSPKTQTWLIKTAHAHTETHTSVYRLQPELLEAEKNMVLSDC